MKYFFSLLLMTLLVTSGCKKQTNVAPTQVLHLNLSDDPVALDPRSVRSLKDLTVVKQLFEGLMRLDAAGVAQPAIAERVTISDDRLTYIFHLRPTVWNNLEPLTAFDFEYAWKSVLSPHFASDYSYMLYPIKNAQQAREGKCSPQKVAITAVDHQTLVVHLCVPTPYFLELVAFPTYFPVNRNKEMGTSYETSSLVSNGPFCLKEWKPQQKISLIKNNTYWDKEAVHLDEIDFSIISDNNTESYLFEKDKLDWLGQPISSALTSEIFSQFKREGKLDSYPIAGTFWLKFNTLKAPFNNVNIRKAFSYAIDRNEIITHILQGNQSLATGPLPPSMSLRNTPYFEDGNTTLAQEHFQKALQENGWTLETFPEVIFNYSPSTRNTKIAQYVQQQWQETFGIKIELQAVENQLYRRNTRIGKYQVGTGEWIADFNDPLAFLELFKELNDATTGHGMNDTNWHHPQFSALLEESLTESDNDRRKQLLLEAESILVNEMPIIPLYHYAFDYVKKPYVEGVILSPLGIADFKTTRLYQN